MVREKMPKLFEFVLSNYDMIKGSRKGIEDVIVSIIPQFITIFIGFIISILIARGIGPGGLGEYALIISITGFVTVISDLGINQTAIRFASLAASTDNKQSQYAVLRWAFRLRMALVIIVVLLIFIIAPYLSEKIWNMSELTPLLRLSLLISVFTVVSSVPIVYFQSIKHFKMNSIVSIGQTAITLVCILFIALLDKWSLDLIIITSIIASIIGAITFIILVPKEAFISLEESRTPFIVKLKNFFNEPDVIGLNSLEDMRPNKFLVYMILSTIIVAIILRLDVWFIGYFLDKQQIGIYSVATYFTIPLTVVLNAINTVIWPRASSLKSNDDIKVFLKTTFSLSLIVAAFGIIYSLFAPLFMPLIFGPSYSEGVLTGQALCLGCCVAIIMCPIGVIGYSYGMIRHYWWINIIQLLLAVIVNIILLPRIGIIASALAIICYNIAGFIIFSMMISIKIKSKPLTNDDIQHYS